MISGYFCLRKEPLWVLKKSIYIFKLLFFAELFYGVWTIVSNCFLQDYLIADVLVKNFENKSLIQILFCGTIFNGVLWYLYAMFWTWLFVFVIKKLKVEKKAYTLIPILLFLQVFGRFYVQNHYDISNWVFLFRNALTFGIPFVLLGMFISQYKIDLLEKINMRRNILIIFLGFFVMIMEYIIVRQYMDVHVSTIILSIGLFLLALKLRGNVPSIFESFKIVGGRWYTWIYLTHVFFINLVDLLYDYLEISKMWSMEYLRPVLVCVCSCLFAEMLENTLERVKKRRGL